jgi:hypothetical protein
VSVATALRPDATEVALAVINRVMITYAKGVHAETTTPLMLQHEAERLEGLPKSPVNTAMRAIVDAERTWRRHLARLGGRG